MAEGLPLVCRRLLGEGHDHETCRAGGQKPQYPFHRVRATEDNRKPAAVRTQLGRPLGQVFGGVAICQLALAVDEEGIGMVADGVVECME
jgi:hypothetical protein